MTMMMLYRVSVAMLSNLARSGYAGPYLHINNMSKIIKIERHQWMGVTVAPWMCHAFRRCSAKLVIADRLPDCKKSSASIPVSRKSI